MASSVRLPEFLGIVGNGGSALDNGSKLAEYPLDDSDSITPSRHGEPISKDIERRLSKESPNDFRPVVTLGSAPHSPIQGLHFEPSGQITIASPGEYMQRRSSNSQLSGLSIQGQAFPRRTSRGSTYSDTKLSLKHQDDIRTNRASPKPTPNESSESQMTRSEDSAKAHQSSPRRGPRRVSSFFNLNHMAVKKRPSDASLRSVSSTPATAGKLSPLDSPNLNAKRSLSMTVAPDLLQLPAVVRERRTSSHSQISTITPERIKDSSSQDSVSLRSASHSASSTLAVEANTFTPPPTSMSTNPSTTINDSESVSSKMKYVKVKTHNQATKHFSRLILAQTLSMSAKKRGHKHQLSADSFESYETTSDKSLASSHSRNTSSNKGGSSRKAQEKRRRKGAIWVLKVSRDGKHLAAGGRDRVIRVWDVISPTDDTGHARSRNGPAQKQADESNPQSRTSSWYSMQSSSMDVRVFNEAPSREYIGHSADILDLAWSRNNFLLSSSMDKTVRLWHVSRQECLCIFQHLDFVTSIAFHPKDDRFFLSGALDAKLRLWNIPDKKVAQWVETPDSQFITAVTFTNDGKTVCAGTHQGTCLFYETEGLRYNTQIALSSPQKHGTQKVNCKITGIEPMPGMPPGKEKLLVTSNDSRIRLINIKDKSIECKYKGLENYNSQIRASFSDNSKHVICASEDRHVYIWDSEQQGVIFPFLHNAEHTGYRHIQKTAAQLGAWGEQVMQALPVGESVTTQTRRVGGWLRKRKEKVKDSLKSGYECFEAHNDTTTAAVFAPIKTKQRLASLGTDLIFSNTIVPHRSETSDGDSIFSGSSGSVDSRSKYTYPDGDIIISADLQGRIRVWRNDCGVYLPQELASNSSFAPPSESSTFASEKSLLLDKAKGTDSPSSRSTVSNLIAKARRTPDATFVSMSATTSVTADPNKTGSFICDACGGNEFKRFVSLNQEQQIMLCLSCNRLVVDK
ncbi:hypothetical protein BZG36_01949 [Bifiguratus adelaidae]|uniref:WD repeat-containing protein 44 n=1 Tax=Bifiguratus adelaidae TaxID=1938954 RepID=A0A261Y3U8_9FUNG|nr:hypothetical protein BZG36_01949 [Bifiguratus adelaidae]